MVCGRSEAYGGAVYAEESISISNSSFLNNMVALVPAMTGAEALGSAVCVDATRATTLVTVALDSCTLTGNIAFHAANSYIATSKGAISVIQVTKLKLESCVFNRNIANKGQVRPLCLQIVPTLSIHLACDSSALPLPSRSIACKPACLPSSCCCDSRQVLFTCILIRESRLISPSGAALSSIPGRR